MKYSSSSPSTRPKRPIGPVDCLAIARAPTADEAHLDHRVFDDGADIEPVLLRDVRDWRCGTCRRRLLELGIALIGAQRVAAGGDEIDDALEGSTSRGRDRARRGGPRRGARPDRTARRRPRRGRAAPARRGRRATGSSLSCALRSTASSAASHSSTSKRLEGTKIALDGSSSGDWSGRCAAACGSRPWARRPAPRDRHRPSRCRGRASRCRPPPAACPPTIAASTLRRCSTASEP